MYLKHREVIIRILTHAGVWLLYFIYENAAVFLIYPKSVFLVSSGLYFLLNAAIFYANYYLILLAGINSFRHFRRILAITALCIVYLICNYALTQFIHSISLPTNMYTSSMKEFIILRTFRFLYIISFSYTYWLVKNKLRMERELIASEKAKHLEIQKRTEIEKEKIKSELNYLRLQINPHFLFNTLSLIYTEVVKYSDKASEGIMLLSNILRNILASADSEGKVWLEDEISHIINLIKIHQLRFNQKMCITLTLPDETLVAGKKILPFILITFIENIFKHGDLLDRKNATVINIKVQDQYLHMFLLNKKKSNNATGYGSGIGMKNVEKRLKLAYADACSLHISEDNYLYSVNLKIPLSNDKLHNN
jgi:two-component system LytT family sensor kinase